MVSIYLACTLQSCLFVQFSIVFVIAAVAADAVANDVGTEFSTEHLVFKPIHHM